MTLFLQILLIFLLILLNGFFVASEIALVSLRRTRITELVRKGKKSALLVQNALDHLDLYISATQLGITVVSIGLGWIGEPILAHALQRTFAFLPQHIAIISAHTVAIIIAFAIITYFEVVLGEIVPKTATLQHAEKVALWFIRPLIIFLKIFRPFIWLLNNSGNVVLRLFGLSTKLSHDKPISEEELTMMLLQSAGTGSIEKEEALMVQKLFKMDDLPIKKLMIPKKQIIAFPLTATVAQAADQLDTHTYSRFPIYKTSVDDIVGFVHIRDLYRLQEEGKDTTSFTQIHLRKIIRVKETTKIDDVLMEMRQKRVHLAVVTDTSKKTCGIVTLENIIESVMGEIQDEFEKS